MEKHGPFEITNSEVKYKNPWIEVVENSILAPNETKGIFGIVNMKPGVSVLALDDDGYVYLTDEFKFAVGRNCIEAVSGGIENGATPIETAKRELKEELGIEAESLIELGTVDPFTSLINSPATLFLARKLSFGESKQDSLEIIKMIKVKFEEAVEMVMDSRINHGPSAVLIMKVNEYLKKESER